MKILAETTGDFSLMDLSTGDHLPSHRPAVVTRTGFIDARATLGQIVKVADVPETATDADFLDFWTESGERELAIASYLATFQPAAETPKSAAQKRSK